MSALAQAVAKALGVPPPDASTPRWHVSPVVDTVAYHFSWLLVLVPLVLSGPAIRDYAWWFLIILGVNFAHRHLTLPYVYFDSATFRRHPLRFTLVPAVALTLFAMSPWLFTHHRAWLEGMATVAGIWNLWHVHMQKYGILRMYNAKSGVPPERRVPGWVDRLLVFGWLPVLVTYGGPHHRDTIRRYYRSGRRVLEPMLDWLTVWQNVLVPIAFAILAFAIVGWLRAEHRASGLKNPARLSMALGTTVLSACFLFFDPFKVALAFAFSHALEYTVFVWAFQRRHYREEHPHRPLLGRLLKRPLLFYVGVIGGCAALYIVLRYWGRYVSPSSERLRIGDHFASRWVFWWAIYQSVVHFYYDGFLWKMRRPALRQDL